MSAAPTDGAPTFDHAVYAGPSLAALVEEIALRTHVRPTHGGAHEGLGTHNALLSLTPRNALGPGRYLELLAPIPGEEERSPFVRRLAALPRPRLYMWAVRVPDVERFVQTGTAAGLAMGTVSEMSRTPPGAPTQRWKLILGGSDVYGSVLPFGIQWTTPGHPSDGLERGCRVVTLSAEHPEPARIQSALEALGVSLRIERAETPGLALELETPAGRVVLR